MRQIPTLELLARSLWLVRNDLLDVGARGLEEPEALALRLRVIAGGDERQAQRTLKALLASQPTLVAVLDWLGEAVFRPYQGLPVLEEALSFRRMGRLLDPDALLCLYRDLALPPREHFDWGAVPMPDSGKIGRILGDGSLDTHIHLGGTLPTLFYWVALMSGELPLQVLNGIPRSERGHAHYEDWRCAVIEAMKQRLGLAAFAQRHAGLFPHLPPIRDPAALQDAFAAQVRDYLLELSWPGRRVRSWTNPQWTFLDPLNGTGDSRVRGHYGAGERRLLCFLGRFLRGSSRTEQAPREWAAGQLLAYLRVRNAFHQLLVHDDGSDGLMRFVETFGRRGALLTTRPHRGRPFSPSRQRRRKMVIGMERSLMTAALDSQLLSPFDGAHTRRGRIEVRVSVPPGNYLLPTVRAWLTGIQDHLRACAEAERETGDKTRRAEDRPCHANSSQIGLIFHFIKSRGIPAQRATEDAHRLGNLLRDYPHLRSFIVGVDAAGDERGTPPRTYCGAFRHLRDLQTRHRPSSGDPPIRLGWTYHVGEDVEDLLTGLRHTSEVSTLLLAPDGGRLGHALALGQEAAHFYRHRGGETLPPIGTHLLDLVWAWGTLGKMHRVEHGQWLEDRIRRLGFAGAPASDPKLHPCYRAMGLDGLGSPGETVATEAELLEILGFKGDPEVPTLVSAEPEWLSMMGLLQDLLIKRLAKERMCIEANPTSNLIIGGYGTYAELPYRRLVDQGLALTLNTDDPGLFVTSLVAEYSAVYDALIRDMSHRQALRWLADRVWDAEQCTFLGPWLPSGQDALDALRGLDRILAYRAEG